ncbi:hypothetical protein BDW59DRAFT_164336 [Aspergillus cavernicola]|uniref:DUF1688-domain-containing protein n=1 Tax=Aspergillus cavernicola TaxID=176166 RepID=A0ABR4I0N5_9EURO
MADIEYLTSLQAVRERAHIVLEAAENGKLSHFTYHPERMSEASAYVVDIITRDFGPDNFDSIPPHGRWQHFEVGNIARVDGLIQKWQLSGCDKLEIVRRLVDLFFVAVLLDAGAGDVWKFKEPETGNIYARSEGIAVAALYMFQSGCLSSQKTRALECVDGHGLTALDRGTFRKAFQITPENPIIGDNSRVSLLNSVGKSLLSLPEIFGEIGRPGYLVDYLLKTAKSPQHLDFKDLWSVLQKVLLPSWPKDRTQIAGIPIGDAWPLEVLEKVNRGKESPNSALHIQPFHKLTQWLAYSLTTPFVRTLGLEWTNMELGTGLPEYRNGGLFIDLGVLKLKEKALKQGLELSQQDVPGFETTSDVIVEWRAMTVALLDKLHEIASGYFMQHDVKLSLAQMLEAGTWKGGRELAAKFRPSTKSSPILIQGDGTLF